VLKASSLLGVSWYVGFYLKYIHAATTIKTTARIQREESLIPAFWAMWQSYPGGLFP